MASDEGKEITLKSSDGEEFVVDEAVAMLMLTILHMIEDGCAEGAIPLPNVNSKILAKVIEYCNKHVDCTPLPSSAGEDRSVEEELKNWDSDFVKVDQATLLDLILAADYLNVEGLQDLTYQTVANMIKVNTPEELFKTLNFMNHFAKAHTHNQAIDDLMDLTRKALINLFTWKTPKQIRKILNHKEVLPRGQMKNIRRLCEKQNGWDDEERETQSLREWINL